MPVKIYISKLILSYRRLSISSSFSLSFLSISVLNWVSSNCIFSVLLSSCSKLPWFKQKDKRKCDNVYLPDINQSIWQKREVKIMLHNSARICFYSSPLMSYGTWKKSELTSTSSSAACMSHFSTSSVFLIFSSSWMVFPPWLICSARSVISSAGTCVMSWSFIMMPWYILKRTNCSRESYLLSDSCNSSSQLT